MKTPEEIKKGLEAIAETEVTARAAKIAAINKSYCYFEEVAVDALKYIRQLEAALPKWISVEDRLPEKPCRVLMNLIGYVNIAWYHGNGTFETPSGVIFEREEITHWMLLPQPPKEEENENAKQQKEKRT